MNKSVNIAAFALMPILALACQDASHYTSISPSDLYKAATNGNKVGGCYIQVNLGGGFCDMYVKTATVGNSGYRGWPRNTRNIGTGCVKAPDYPKKVSTCYYTSSEYRNWAMADRTSFCTPNGMQNAVAQLRHAVLNKQCALPTCPTTTGTWNLNSLVPEAQKSGWNCGHSSGKGSCFVSTAVYIGKLIGKCSGCYDQLTQPTDSQDVSVVQIPEDPAECQGCAQTAQSEAPMCGGTFLGINSGKKGRSCKLVDGKGCWPLKSAPVLHDCGAGAECRFKVSKAKAKIWCCRKKKSCKWWQAACKWRNTFRCSNSALSSSKDRDGAQVMWQN